MKTSFAICCTRLSLLLLSLSVDATEPPAVAPHNMPQMFVPGFSVRELPLKLTSLNNVEYSSDGRLFAGGYDGRFHLLCDTDGDGLEDQVKTFWSESGPNYPLGMVVKNGDPHALLSDEIVRFRDTNSDGVPDKRETVVEKFDDPELVTAAYLHHRRVDSSLALAYGPDGAWYLTMGNAAHDNPYWQESFKKGESPSGSARYSTDKRRGCLLRIGPDGKVEQWASGLRYVMSLQFNAEGDLFGTDQEGATWCPNGNPFDELLHLQKGRHYGFPPRHPQFLPDVIDEPSVWDYRPQHQSTCGFRFNTPMNGRGRFGPEFWEDDAIVTGEARGKLWRTALAKTAAGYVAQSRPIANLGLLVVDCAISPQGDLVVCCHTGKPDWGNGPNGDGRIFKITYSDPDTPQPVLAWAAGETESVILFDRPLNEESWRDVASSMKIVFGRYVGAGDAAETIRPGYKVVQMQQRQPRRDLAIRNAAIGDDRRTIVISTPERTQSLDYAIQIAQSDRVKAGLDLEFNLTGLAVDWFGKNSVSWHGWLPHPDVIASKRFTRSSSLHDVLWRQLDTPGTLEMRGQLDLFNMLQPATQPGSELDYTPTPETVTLVFRSDGRLTMEASGAKIDRVSDFESHCTFANIEENHWIPFAISLATPANRLDVSFYTDRDSRPRSPGIRRFLMPFATLGSDDHLERQTPELAGGNWDNGRELFNGKAACATCHPFRGEGVAVGPDLNNLVHRDYASVLRDVVDPNAAINPDAIGYIVRLNNGTIITGVRFGESSDMLSIAQAGGKVVKVVKAEIEEIKTMTTSLMPTGLEKTLARDELRDLMMYLLSEKPGASKVTEKSK